MTSGKLFIVSVVGACLTASTVTGTTLAHWQRSISVPGVAVTADLMHAPALRCEDGGLLGGGPYLRWTAPTEGAAPASYVVFRNGSVLARMDPTETELEVGAGTYQVESSLAPPGAPLDTTAWMSKDSNGAEVEYALLRGTYCTS